MGDSVMKVSFLVTYFNQCQYVNDSLQSILNIEKPFEWEILVGDDGSDDGTIEKVQEYVNAFPENIILFVMPREKGEKYDSVQRASANRLYLLEHATGDFFCVLDGDDYYCDKLFVKDAIDIFEQDKELSVVSFGYKTVVDGVDGNEVLLPVGARGKRVDKKNYIRSFYLHAGACVHKMCGGQDRIEYIKKIGYFDDNDIVINSLNYGEMYHIGRVIYAYRQSGDSVYNSMSELERAVLNVQGMDVDLCLMKKEYRNDIIRRYIGACYMMFKRRKELENELGYDKYLRYMQGCQKTDNSIGYRIMIYDSLPKEERKEIIQINRWYRYLRVMVVPKRIAKKVLHFAHK